jgi:pyridoxamine 5'-phosphate oxidase family protein
VGGHGQRDVTQPHDLGRVALVVDDLVSVDPWTPRFLRVYGTAELVEREGRFGPARYMRITAEISWSSNLDDRSSTDENQPSGPRRTVHRGGQ